MIRTASNRMNRLVAQVCEERQIAADHKGSAAPMGGLGRLNFAKESEDATNAHIVKELFGSMSYLAMHAYFDRADLHRSLVPTDADEER